MKKIWFVNLMCVLLICVFSISSGVWGLAINTKLLANNNSFNFETNKFMPYQEGEYWYINIGNYPQSYVGDGVVPNGASVSTLAQMIATDRVVAVFDGYQSSNADDYFYTIYQDPSTKEEYIKANSLIYYTDTKYDDGTVAPNGTSVWFKFEPIKWQILGYFKNGAYVSRYNSGTLNSSFNPNQKGVTLNITTDRSIMGMAFDKNGYNSWDNSAIKAWLNGEVEYGGGLDSFYNTAFSAEEIKNINGLLDGDTLYPDYTEQCKIWLLSYTIITNGTSFTRDNRVCDATDFAKARRIEYHPYEYKGNYWLGTTFDEDAGENYTVLYDKTFGGDVRNEYRYGVRPAMYFNI